MDSPVNFAESIHPIKTAFTGVACANCLTSDKNLVRCSGCKRAMYCSRSCQQANWKVHKGECAYLKLFKESHATLSGISLSAKEHNMKLLVERMVQDNTAPPALRSVKDHWSRYRKFILFTRVCSICRKNEYEFEEEPKWISCPTCKFGWCCSQEHWDEYKEKHTKEICDCYVQSIALERFNWQHVKKYNDTFLYMPQDTAEEVAEAFPANWEEYFLLRCPDQYQYHQQGRLPREYFPTSTVELSQPATCLYAMYQHGISAFKDLRTVTVHVVGASYGYEIAPSGVWEEILHFLPGVSNLKVVMIGPEACTNFSPPSDFWDCGEVTTCPTCSSRNRSRTQSFEGKTYHEYAASTRFATPDLIVAFNTGMHEECVESWRASLEVILDMGVPSIFTSYNKDEADQDYGMLASLNANLLTDAPVLNPVREIVPTIELWEKTDAFFHRNMYCMSFKGRV